MVVQLAGTGDHVNLLLHNQIIIYLLANFLVLQFFWRRRILMGKPLMNEWNIGSIILENPFYGLRKPKEQKYEILYLILYNFVQIINSFW